MLLYGLQNGKFVLTRPEDAVGSVKPGVEYWTSLPLAGKSMYLHAAPSKRYEQGIRALVKQLCRSVISRCAEGW